MVFAVARLSVCLSVTLVHCIHTSEDIVELLSRPGRPIILVFDLQCRYPISRETPSAGGAKQGGGKNLPFSTEIAVYL